MTGSLGSVPTVLITESLGSVPTVLEVQVGVEVEK
jgi:hypothetical protein